MSTLEIEKTEKEIIQKILNKSDVGTFGSPPKGPTLPKKRNQFQLFKSGPSPLENFNYYFKNSPTLIAPIVQASYDSAAFNIFLVLHIPYNSLTEESFTLQYKLGLGSGGKSQLNVLCNYSINPNTDTDISYTYYTIGVTLPQVLFFNGGSGVDASSIETVRAFLIDDDPVTSRGTVTTVQSGDS